MKKLFFVIIFSFIFSRIVDCQEAVKPQLILKFTPTAFLDLYHPTLQIGIQKKYSDKYGLEFNLGIPVLWGTPILESYSYNYGKWFPFKYKFEYQYFPGYKKREDPKFYFAGEYYLLTGFGNYTKGNYEFLYFGDAGVYSCDEAKILKIVNTLSIKIGSQVKTKTIFLDYYFGLGVRLRYLKFSDFKNSQFFAEHITDQPMDMSMQEGNIVLPHINAGIKIGFLLNKKQNK